MKLSTYIKRLAELMEIGGDVEVVEPNPSVKDQYKEAWLPELVNVVPLKDVAGRDLYECRPGFGNTHQVVTVAFRADAGTIRRVIPETPTAEDFDEDGNPNWV